MLGGLRARYPGGSVLLTRAVCMTCLRLHGSAARKPDDAGVFFSERRHQLDEFGVEVRELQLIGTVCRVILHGGDGVRCGGVSNTRGRFAIDTRGLCFDVLILQLAQTVFTGGAGHGAEHEAIAADGCFELSSARLQRADGCQPACLVSHSLVFWASAARALKVFLLKGGLVSVLQKLAAELCVPRVAGDFNEAGEAERLDFGALGRVV